MAVLGVYSALTGLVRNQNPVPFGRNKRAVPMFAVTTGAVIVSTLLERVLEPGSLESAWAHVLARATASGTTTTAVQRFESQADREIRRLRNNVGEGSYRPGLLSQVSLPKDSGGIRVLDVAPVADRVLERAILDVITPHIDPALSPAALGYRPGLGAGDAVARVAGFRDEGLTWVLRTDIEDCFPSIPRDRAVAAASALLPDDSLVGLIEMLTSRRTVTNHGIRNVPGLAQGTALSPLLCNLTLAPLDNALLDRGYAVTRFADDLAVACETKPEAVQARQETDAALNDLGMKLSNDKTDVVEFSEGFCFLGEDFGPRYPLVQSDHRVQRQVRQAVYVAVQGSLIYMRSGRLIVQSKNKEVILDVPISHVSRIVCFGSVGLTSGVRSWSLYNSVDVVFLSRKGSYLGQQLSANSPHRVRRLRAQLNAADDTDKSLAFARAVVISKIRHQIALIQHFSSRGSAGNTARSLSLMRLMADLAAKAPNNDELMGAEGAAAKTYFEAWGHLLPDSFEFTGRNRRPPLDVVNAALGYAYAILLGECVSALVAVSLDPGIGLLHAEQKSRPSLALDLMEEFRPMVVDQVVVRLCRRRSLTPEHGEKRAAEDGIFLTRQGKSVLLDAYEKRMLQRTSGAIPGFTGTLRRHIYRQAERLWAYLDGRIDTWQGLSWR